MQKNIKYSDKQHSVTWLVTLGSRGVKWTKLIENFNYERVKLERGGRLVWITLFHSLSHYFFLFPVQLVAKKEDIFQFEKVPGAQLILPFSPKLCRWQVTYSNVYRTKEKVGLRVQTITHGVSPLQSNPVTICCFSHCTDFVLFRDIVQYCGSSLQQKTSAATGPCPETAYCMSPKPAVQGPHHYLSPTNKFFSIADSAVYISR